MNFLNPYLFDFDGCTSLYLDLVFFYNFFSAIGIFLKGLICVLLDFKIFFFLSFFLVVLDYDSLTSSSANYSIWIF